jgi:hypothetical protein
MVFKSSFVLALSLSIFCVGCSETDPVYRYGFDLAGLELNLHTADMGVYPDTSVLDDPSNPFKWGAMEIDTKWDIENTGRVVARFYCWATMLAREPAGEHQYYTATALEEIWVTKRANETYLPFVKTMAIRGYQSVLNHFPDSVSYLPDGVTFFPLNILAYDALVAMDETPEGDWYVIEDEQGGRKLMKGNL